MPQTTSTAPLSCRPHCGACCIAPSISTPLPGLPNGKPANVACPHLDEALRCTLFGKPERPKVCREFIPCEDVCGNSQEQALELIRWLENET